MIFIFLLVISLASAKVYPRTGVDDTSNIHDEVEGVLYEITEYEDPDVTLYRLAQRGAYPIITVMEVPKELKDVSKDEGAKHHYQINGVRTELNDAMAQLYIAKTKLKKGDAHISMDIDKTIYFLMNLKHSLHQEADLKTGSTEDSSSDAHPKNSLVSSFLAKPHSPSIISDGQFTHFDTSNKHLSLSDILNKQFSLFNSSKKQFTSFKAPFESSSTSDAVSTISSFDVPSEETTESFSSVEPIVALDSPSKEYAETKFSTTKYLSSEESKQRIPGFDAAIEHFKTSESNEQNSKTTTPATKYLASDALENRYLDFDKPIQKPDEYNHHIRLSLAFGNPKIQYSVSTTSVEPFLADDFSSERHTSDVESSSTSSTLTTKNPDIDGASQKKAEGLYEDSIYIDGSNKYEGEENGSIHEKWSWIPPAIE